MNAQGLKEWRELHGWTQDEAARYLGTSQVNVSRWEIATHKIPGATRILMELLRDKKIRRMVEKMTPIP